MPLPLRAFLAICWLCAAFPHLRADLAWKAPSSLPFGQLTVLELREEDPSRPPLPRPGDDRLGPLPLRAAERTPDGRGWRLTVQPLEPGRLLIPSLDLGEGRRTPELRLTVPRTTPHGAPWMGVGGGHEDVLPQVPFPWAWASLLALPCLGIGWLGFRWRRRGAPKRLRARAKRVFSHAWPPQSRVRSDLDKGHASGRELLASVFGEEARAWGSGELRRQGLHGWSRWNESLDAARFGQSEPPFPDREALLKELGL